MCLLIIRSDKELKEVKYADSLLAMPIRYMWLIGRKELLMFYAVDRY